MVRINQVISVTDIILALAAFYGLSGAFFKVYRSLATIKYNYTGRQKNPEAEKLDIELTRIVNDVFAFTLISTGFLIEVMNASFTFSVNPTLLLISGILQNGYTWFYGSSLGNIRSGGRTGHSLLYEAIYTVFVPNLRKSDIPKIWSELRNSFNMVIESKKRQQKKFRETFNKLSEITFIQLDW